MHLRAIPAVLSRLNADFDTEQPSPNRVAAWTLTSQLRRRLRMHRDGAHDGAHVDVLTGCEVCFWAKLHRQRQRYGSSLKQPG